MSSDEKLKAYLTQELSLKAPDRGVSAYPSADDLYQFIMGEMEGEDLRRILDHLRRDPDTRRLVSTARTLSSDFKGADRQKVPAELLAKAKRLGPASNNCPHCGKSLTAPVQYPARQVFWSRFSLVLGAVFFACSFILPGYFLQFLALALFFAFKGLLDARNAKSQILIFKALKDDSKKRHEDLHKTGTPL